MSCHNLGIVLVPKHKVKTFYLGTKVSTGSLHPHILSFLFPWQTTAYPWLFPWGEGVLPIIADMERLHPKGVPFLGFRYTKGKGFHYVKGVPFVNRKYTKGYHFWPEMACNQDKGLDHEGEPSRIKLCWLPSPPLGLPGLLKFLSDRVKYTVTNLLPKVWIQNHLMLVPMY